MADRDNELVFAGGPEVSPASSDDFQFVQLDKTIHEQRFQGKATSYGRDSVKRFMKNKTSVVGFCLLGLILLLAIVFSFALPGNVDKQNPTTAEQYLPPKVFKAGTGFWDGTRVYHGRVYNRETGLPEFSSGQDERGFMYLVGEPYEGYYNYETETGTGGYIQIDVGYYLATPALDLDLSLTASGEMEYDYTLSMAAVDYVADDDSYNVDYDDTTFSIYLQPLYTDEDSGTTGASRGSAILVAEGLTLNTDTGVTEVDLSSYLADVAFGEDEDSSVPSRDSVTYAKFLIQCDAGNMFVSSAQIRSDYADYSEYDITDACQAMYQTRTLETDSSATTAEKAAWWTRSSSSTVHAMHVEMLLCDYRYDPYEVVYGIQQSSDITGDDLSQMRNNGIVTYELNNEGYIDLDTFQILDEDACLIVNPYDDEGNLVYPMTVEHTSGLAGVTWSVTAYIYGYKKLGYSSMPIHVMGTDAYGLDMLKSVSVGLLYSLGIAIAISAVCFAFGLCWGSFSGYQGGWIDLGMERIVDILSYLPSMVIITLLMLNMGRTWYVFLIAMVITGWIGTSSITRTQFYRFKRREYVLAARSLGAKDSRLIFRHILPNSLGTIITSSVLMIPSVIYSEASLAYLGLGFQDINSMGSILQSNQTYISTVGFDEDLTFLILFPSIVLALLLICFELFGQGLRDAVDPNTKGSESF